MASSAEQPPADVARAAATRHLGQCTSVHQVGSALRTISIAIAYISGSFTVLVLFDATGIAAPIPSLLLTICMFGAFLLMIAGLVHRGEAVYMYPEGLVYVDRTSVIPIRFDEIRFFERIAQGRRGYRIAGGGYWIRVTSLVGNSAALGQRLDEEVRRHGGHVK
jgi:hypothetical protein